MSPGAGSTGRRLGRYHLAEPLGGGPTGEVFRAKVYGVAGFEREFAVKRLHAEFVSAPEIAATIAAATRTYGSLEHPRIARLYEYGVASGASFTATEFIHGLDMSRLLGMTRGADDGLPPGAAVSLVSQAARAVGYAHGRGVSHLGLCPTNVIATPDGDVKITDFCLLPPRLPDRPGEDFSLHARMPYLAPEQLVGEPTSPTTDVYQLAALAYEMLAGKPAFTGPTSPDISRKILASELPALDLPAPLISVLQRCFQRSPFERYPDARALADALDAAAREADLPGGQRELGACVRDLMARAQDMNDSNNSGAVSFPLPAPPSPHLSYQSARASRGTKTAPPARIGIETVPMPTLEPGSISGGLPSLADPAPGSARLAGKSTRQRGASTPGLPPLTLKDKLRGSDPMAGPDDESEATEIGYLEEEAPTTIRHRDNGFVSAADSGEPATVDGLPVPNVPAARPAPRPAADAVSPAAAPRASEPRASSTLPFPAQIAPVQGAVPPSVIPEPPRAQRPAERSGTPAVPPGPRSRPHGVIPQPPGPGARPASAGPSLPLDPNMPPGGPGAAPRPQPGASPRAPVAGPGNSPASPGAGALPAGGARAPASPASPASFDPNEFTVLETLAPGDAPLIGASAGNPQQPSSRPGASQGPDGMPLPSPPESMFLPDSKRAEAGDDAGRSPDDATSPPPARKPWGWLVAAVVLCGLGVGGYMFRDSFLPGILASIQGNAAEPRDAAPGSAPEAKQAAAATGGDTDEPDQPDAPQPGTPASGAAVAAGDGNEDEGEDEDEGDDEEADDTGEEDEEAGSEAAGEADKLIIRSKPRRARVYLDGSFQGKTPLTLDATTDRHRLAIILPGHELHTSDIDGNGTIEVTLGEVAPPAGPAGIKVRCRKKNRYYVIIDGHDTGQLCPSERIGVEVGEHKLEIYDPVSDSRQEFPVTVEDTHRSLRIRVD